MNRLTSPRALRLLALVLFLAIFLQTAAGCVLSGSMNPESDTKDSVTTVEPETSDTAETTSGETTGTETADASTTGGATTEEAPPPADPPRYSVGHPELVYDFTEEDETALREALTALEAMIDGETAEEEDFLAYYDEVEDMMYDMLTDSRLAYVESFLYKTEEGRAENYLYISALSNELIQEFVSYYRTIYDSAYGDAFYEDWTKEEIEDALHEADTFDEECAALQTKIDEIQQNYRDLPDEEFTKGSAELYRELIATGTALAKKLGYDGYMEYAYSEIYERDYTVADASKISDFAKEKIPPVLKDALARVRTAKLSAEDRQVVNFILSGSFESKYCRKVLDGYYEMLGGDIYEAYLNFWEDGYYYIGYTDGASEEGAFTFYLDAEEVPVLYFGPGYQDALTFVHEFGHYYQYIKQGNDGSLPFDLAETHSQGDEWLFIAYLVEEVFEEDSAAAQYIVDYSIANDLLMLFVCLTVNEFETACYANGGAVAPEANFDAIYREAANAVWNYSEMWSCLGYLPEQYWRHVTIENPGYYVSYAISQIPSIEFFVLGTEDLAGAAAAYELLQSTDGGFLEVLAAAGLSSPFEAEIYEKIAEAFS